jgi:hypothetical protein
MNPGLTLIAILQGKPEKRDELLATLREFVKPTRAEQGCVEYHLHVSDEDPNYLKTPLLAAFGSRTDLLEKPVDMR